MHSLVVRSDAMGDMVLAGPAIRAVAAHSDRVTVLAGPAGTDVAHLLPGVDEVITWAVPWIDRVPVDLTPAHLNALFDALPTPPPDRAFVLTSDHQSPLPMALALRLAGVGWIGATSVDYGGSLLDLRYRPDQIRHEVERSLSMVGAAGCVLPGDDDGRLRLRDTASAPRTVAGDYVVLHPGTSVPARGWCPDRYVEVARRLARSGVDVVVTGTAAERDLTAAVAAAGDGTDLAGRTDVAGLVEVLRHARALVAGNTGPAHLAAAVGTPVVSLFAPTVRAAQWAPYRVPHVVLGDQHAGCRHSRWTVCRQPGHPCLAQVTAADVVAALHQLATTPATSTTPMTPTTPTPHPPPTTHRRNP